MPAICLTAAAAAAAAAAADAAASDCGQGLLVAPRHLAATCTGLLNSPSKSFIRSFIGWPQPDVLTLATQDLHLHAPRSV